MVLAVMSWNFRIIRHADDTVSIHEVFYDDKETPRVYAPASLGPEENCEALRWFLESMLRAMTEPVLDISVFGDHERPETTSDRTAELEARLAGLHRLIRDAEVESRAAMLEGTHEAFERVVSNYIIDGAIACKDFGPCPGCGERPSICAAQSPGDPDDEDDPPVTCTREPGHEGAHEGGTRCGTVSWVTEWVK